MSSEQSVTHVPGQSGIGIYESLHGPYIERKKFFEPSWQVEKDSSLVMISQRMLKFAFVFGFIWCLAFVGSANCYADANKKQSQRSTDSVASLSEQLGKMKASRESLIFYAKMFKNNKRMPEAIEAKGAEYYNDVRDAYNGWIDSVLTDYWVRRDPQKVAAYASMAKEAANKVGVFIEYARKNASATLIKDGPAVGVNVAVSLDFNKLLTDLFSAISNSFNAVSDAVHFLGFKGQLEELRLPLLEELYIDNSQTDLIVLREDEANALKGIGPHSLRKLGLGRAAILQARQSMVSGKFEEALKTYETVMSDVREAIKLDPKLTGRALPIVNDYVDVLDELSKHERSSAILTEFEKNTPSYRNVDFNEKSREKAGEIKPPAR